jgi:hypothetical protein
MALVSVPCLLLPKPLLLKKQHESNARFQARFPPDSIPRESRESIATRTAPAPAPIAVSKPAPCARPRGGVTRCGARGAQPLHDDPEEGRAMDNVTDDGGHGANPPPPLPSATRKLHTKRARRPAPRRVLFPSWCLLHPWSLLRLWGL